MKRFGLLSVFVVLILVVISLPVFAGTVTPEVSPLDIEADCDSVSVTFGQSGNGGYWSVLISKAGGSPVFYDEDGEGSSGSVSGPLDPALEDGDQLVIEVQLYQFGPPAKIQAGKPSTFGGTYTTAYSMRQLTVSCPPEPTATNTPTSTPVTPSPSQTVEPSSTPVTPAPSPTATTFVDTVTAIKQCNDGRLNIYMCEPLAIYAVDYDGEDGMVSYFIYWGNDFGHFAFEITPEELAALPTDVEEVCVIASSANGLAVAYLLPSGEIQVNAGPDNEGKVFIYRFSEFPSIPDVDTYMGTGTALPTAPPCVA